MERNREKQQKKKVRMSAEERRESIIRAVIPVFADKGFAAATTKDLAKAAGVSEALLYRHFPSKESLYENIQEKICSSNSSIHDYIYALQPSAESLIKMTYLIFKIVYKIQASHPLGRSVPRLMIQSMLEDGEFTRSFNKPRFRQILPYMEASVKAAIEVGEIGELKVSGSELLWFPHHLALSLKLASLPENQVFDYTSNPYERRCNAVRFALRGIGLADEVIEKYFKPELLNPEINDVLFRAGMRPPPEEKLT